MLGKFFRAKSLADRIESEYSTAFSGRRNFSFTMQLEPVEQKTVEIWLPIPPNTRTQTKKKEKFSTPVTFVEDRDFGNKLAIFELVSRFTYEVEIEVSPQNNKDFFGNIKSYQGREAALYLREDSYFDKENTQVRRIAKKLAESKTDISEIIPAFYNYVKEKLVYGDPIEGLYSAREALERSKVDCGGFDSLLGALLRAVGVPSRLVSGFLLGYPGEHMHAWIEAMTPLGEWIPLDPSMEWLREKERDWKPGGLGQIGNDRLIISYGTNIKVKEKTLPLLQYPQVTEEGIVVKRRVFSEEI